MADVVAVRARRGAHTRRVHAPEEARRPQHPLLDLQQTAGNTVTTAAVRGTIAVPHEMAVSRLVEPGARTHTTLHPGMNHAEVGELQTKLNAAIDEVKLTVNNVYDARTQAAVKRFQAASHLKDDAIVGPNTWEALDSMAGGTKATQESGARISALHAAATTAFSAGDYKTARDRYFDLYSDPHTAHKHRGRSNITYNIAACEHLLGNFIQAVGFYQEAMAAPGASISTRSASAENLRRARMQKPFLRGGELAKEQSDF